MKEKILQHIKKLFKRFIEDDVLALASQLAYSFILAFFPFLIFLMTLVGYSSISSVEVLSGLNKMIPTTALDLITHTIVEVVDSQNGQLMSFSLIFTIWSASAGFNAVIKGLNKAYDEDEGRSFIKVQLIAVISTVGLSIVIFVMILLLVFGEAIGNTLAMKMGFSDQFKVLWLAVRYIVIILTTIFIFAAVYYYAPSRRLMWKEVFPGSVLTTIGLILVSIGFAFYVNNFGNYSRIYGSIGAVIVLLTWLFLGAVIIIMGGELNATLAFDKEGK